MGAEQGTPRGRGRPKGPVLSSEGIYRGALRVIDELGLHRFSVPQLAAHLGVSPSSLYNHVTGRADILDGVREVVLAEVDLTPLEQLAWPESVVQWASSYRAALTAHPHTAALFSGSGAATTPRALRMLDLLVAQLHRNGCREQLLLRTATAVNALVLGAALPQGPPTRREVRGQKAAVPYLRRALHAAYPADQAALTRDGFEAGLRSLLTSLAPDAERSVRERGPAGGRG